MYFTKDGVKKGRGIYSDPIFLSAVFNIYECRKYHQTACIYESNLIFHMSPKYSGDTQRDCTRCEGNRSGWSL